jgi:type II secretory ATPase GspE/PulE/Tfp pilus assembly ATPase PilB-like protein
LLELLRVSGCPDEAEARKLAENQGAGGAWTASVLDSGKVDEVRFAAELGKLFGSPTGTINLNRFDRSSLGLLPSRFVFKHQILPMETVEDRVRLATFDVFNGVARRLAQQLIGKKVEWVIVPRGQLIRAIKSLYGVGAETFDEILKSSRTLDAVDERNQSTDLDADDPEASVVKFVNQIIREAINERATDIHVEPLENDLRIRYRIDGILHEVAVPPQLRLLQSAIISRIKVMSHMDIAEKRLPQDGRINLQHGADAIDVRVSTVPTVNGESVSLRLLSRSATLKFGVDRLELAPRQHSMVETLLDQPNGIILVTGPTGSGKSTTLYSFITSINSVTRRILTVEEPVEYRLRGIAQIDVKPEIGLTFATGLRHILRQDPDVVMVGEIRDFETAEIAIRAAMTGHLVFSTLHTNDAVGGITRLLDMGLEPFLLSSVVRAFIAQRLVRCICTDCIEEATYPADYLKSIGAPTGPEAQYWRGAGCESCRQTGYRGRTAIFEFCLVSERLQRLIVAKAPGSELKQAAMQRGMSTLRQDGWRRVLARQTTVEEIVRVTQSDEEMTETEV